MRDELEISIHALREEGDEIKMSLPGVQGYFYPRPPRGGRLESGDLVHIDTEISIHALREEGDLAHWAQPDPAEDFYPRPPRGGRPG